MKLLLKVHGPVAIEDAHRMISGWMQEEAGYYGTPAGQRRILHHLSHVKCGLTESVPVGDPEHTWSVWLSTRWLTCGGNDHRIAIVGDEVIVAYEGRRHGMRAEFREFIETYWGDTREGGVPTPRIYQTTEPDWMPWGTRDSHSQLGELMTPDEQAELARSLVESETD